MNRTIYEAKKGANQLRGYPLADLSLCFEYANSRVSHDAAQIMLSVHTMGCVILTSMIYFVSSHCLQPTQLRQDLNNHSYSYVCYIRYQF